MTHTLSQAEIFRYSRHLILPEVGLEGQKKLKQASVLIVGTGGLGSPIALYLAAAGVGRIGLVDYDAVDDSNLQRQIAHSTSRIGDPKVESARDRLADLNPYIQLDTYLEPFLVDNAAEIAAPYDILIDGTDNFPTRYLLNDLAVLTGKPYVYGSIFRFEGQVSVFDARRGPCYRCLFPEAPPAGLVPSCSEGGVLGILPGTIGTLQAAEVIKLILGIGEPLIGKLLLYDALDTSFQTVQLRKNPGCQICGSTPQITTLQAGADLCGPWDPHEDRAALTADWLITPRELARKMDSAQPPQLLDVRDPVEQQVSALPAAITAPINQLHQILGQLPRDKELVAFCRTGVRSARAVRILREAGFEHVRSLTGGINAWAREIDPTLMQY